MNFILLFMGINTIWKFSNEINYRCIQILTIPKKDLYFAKASKMRYILR